jgi:MYXO-CTERM domain-containing protein
MSKRLLVIVALGFLISIGCGGPEQPSSASSKTHEIVNGQLHKGHPAVGALVARQGSMCTATLVGKRTVLTAAHCISPGESHAFYLDNSRWFVHNAVRHPEYNANRIANDVGVVILTHEPPIEPAKLGIAAPELGQELTLVGLGATSTEGGGSGRKRIAKNKVAALHEDRIVIRYASGDVGNLCFGDSGGPTFATINGQEVQVGIHSYIVGQCGDTGADMRVDAYLDWIRETAAGDVFEGGFSDAEPPTVIIESPTVNDLIIRKMKVRASVQDNVGAGQIVLYVNDIKKATVVGGKLDVEIEVEPGPLAIKVVGRDRAGNAAEAKVDVEASAPLEFGAACEKGHQCQDEYCVIFSAENRQYCSQECNPNAAEPCPQGAACLAVGKTNLCGPPAAPRRGSEDGAAGSGSGKGGCSVSHGGSPLGFAFWSLLGLLLIALPRRRR